MIAVQLFFLVVVFNVFIFDKEFSFNSSCLAPKSILVSITHVKDISEIVKTRSCEGVIQQKKGLLIDYPQPTSTDRGAPFIYEETYELNGSRYPLFNVDIRGFVLIDQTMFPSALIYSSNFADCTCVAIKAKKNNETFYGIAHIFIGGYEKNRNLYEDIKFIQTTLIRYGFDPAKIEYFVDYHVRRYDHFNLGLSHSDQRNIIKLNFGEEIVRKSFSKIGFRRRVWSETDDVLLGLIDGKIFILEKDQDYDGNGREMLFQFDFSNDNTLYSL